MLAPQTFRFQEAFQSLNSLPDSVEGVRVLIKSMLWSLVQLDPILKYLEQIQGSVLARIFRMPVGKILNHPIFACTFDSQL